MDTQERWQQGGGNYSYIQKINESYSIMVRKRGET